MLVRDRGGNGDLTSLSQEHAQPDQDQDRAYQEHHGPEEPKQPPHADN